jgi:hypothetical protein
MLSVYTKLSPFQLHFGKLTADEMLMFGVMLQHDKGPPPTVHTFSVRSKSEKTQMHCSHPTTQRPTTATNHIQQN